MPDPARPVGRPRELVHPVTELRVRVGQLERAQLEALTAGGETVSELVRRLLLEAVEGASG